MHICSDKENMCTSGRLGRFNSHKMTPMYSPDLIHYKKQDNTLESNIRAIKVKTQLLAHWTADPSSQLKILRHDCHSLSVDGTQICVFKQTRQMCLSSFLQCKNCVCLPAILLIVGDIYNLNFPHKARKWQPPYQQICISLVISDLLQGTLSRSVPSLCVRTRNCCCCRQGRLLRRFAFPC